MNLLSMCCGSATNKAPNGGSKAKAPRTKRRVRDARYRQILFEEQVRLQMELDLQEAERQNQLIQAKEQEIHDQERLVQEKLRKLEQRELAVLQKHHDLVQHQHVKVIPPDSVVGGTSSVSENCILDFSSEDGHEDEISSRLAAVPSSVSLRSTECGHAVGDPETTTLAAGDPESGSTTSNAENAEPNYGGVALSAGATANATFKYGESTSSSRQPTPTDSQHPHHQPPATNSCNNSRPSELLDLGNEAAGLEYEVAGLENEAAGLGNEALDLGNEALDLASEPPKRSNPPSPAMNHPERETKHGIAKGHKSLRVDVGVLPSSVLLEDSGDELEPEDPECKSAEQVNDSVGELMKSGELGLAKGQLKFAVRQATEQGDQLSLARGYGNLASVYELSDEPEKAIVYYRKSLSILRTLDEPVRESYLLHNAMVSCTKLNLFQEALNYARRNDDLLENNPNAKNENKRWIDMLIKALAGSPVPADILSPRVSSRQVVSVPLSNHTSTR